jgi:hypothetical protein
MKVYRQSINGIVFFLSVSVFFYIHYDFIFGDSHIFHDNLPFLSDLILSNRGEYFNTPQIRSVYQTLGIPTWINSEIRIGFDPIAIFILKLISNLKLDLFNTLDILFSIYYISASAGLYMILNYLKVGILSKSLFLVYFFISPFSFSIWAQGYGFLLPFKYIPWIIYLYLVFIQSAKKSTFTILIFFICLTFQNYQFIYAAFVLAVLFLTLNSKKNYIVLIQTFKSNIIFYSSMIFVPLFSLIPLFVAVDDLKNKIQVLPRTIDIPPYSTNFFSTYIGHFSSLNYLENWWHGSTWVGYFPIFIISISMFIMMINRIKYRFILKLIFKLMIVYLILIYFSTSSPLPFPVTSNFLFFNEKTFFGLRNWGFVTPIASIILYLCATLLLDAILKWNSIKKNVVPVFLISIAILLLVFDFGKSLQEKTNLISTYKSLYSRDLQQNISIDFLYDNSFRTLKDRSFLFDPTSFYPITIEGASIWKVSSMNYLSKDDQYIWKFKPTTTITHSYEYVDFYRSSSLDLFKNEDLWRQSRLSQPFFISSNFICLSKEDYVNVSTYNLMLLSTDFIQVQDMRQPFCKEAEMPSHRPERVIIKQIDNNRLEIFYNSSKDFFLIINQNYDDNFRLTGPTKGTDKIFPTNWRSTGIFLGPGTKTLTLEYFPVRYLFWNQIRSSLLFLLLISVTIMLYRERYKETENGNY